MDLSIALVRFFDAFETVDEMVSACAQLGIELVRPRKMLIYRRRLEGFVDQARIGILPAGAVSDLYEAIEAIDSPELITEELTMAGIRGKGIAKFRMWEKSYDQLVTASLKAWQELDG